MVNRVGFALGLLAAASAGAEERLLVLGFDGADPDVVATLIEAGELPHLARLAEEGTFAALGTTTPSESPVAWATFATGMNPGRTRIFDFLEKTPGGYAPRIALVRESQRALPGLGVRIAVVALLLVLAGLAFRWRRWAGLVGLALAAVAFGGSWWTPRWVPEAVRSREGHSFWKLAGEAGVPTVALSAPMDFPVERSDGSKVLAGFGVPDVRRSFGLWSLYTSDLVEEATTETGGTRFPLRFADGVADSVIRGPRDFTESAQPELEIPIRFARSGSGVSISVQDHEIRLEPHAWSDFVPVRFALNPLVRLFGTVRFRLLETEPNLSVYMEPINFDPRRIPSLLPLSWPRSFAGELAERNGVFETIGWKIVTNPLRDGAVPIEAFLEDARFARETNERLLMDQLGGTDWRLLVSVFLFPDRLQHMLYRFADPDHPNHDPERAFLGEGIAGAYRDMDRIVGEATAAAPPGTRILVVSDHGFHSFRKQFNVNTWLAQNGYMAAAGDGAERRLEDLFRPGSLFFEGVDWSRTEAFALGLSGIYLNQRGREPAGIVAPGAERDALVSRLVADLLAFEDPETGERIVRSVHRREDVYEGDFLEEAPDLILGLAPGYRIGWQSTLGGMPADPITPNLDDWSGDHCSMEDVDGVVLANFALRGGARLRDVAPTALELLGVAVPESMDGRSLLP